MEAEGRRGMGGWVRIGERRGGGGMEAGGGAPVGGERREVVYGPSGVGEEGRC